MQFSYQNSSIHSFVISDGGLSYRYVSYKIVFSIYLVAVYILSHLDYYWQQLTPCSSKANLSLNVTNQTSPDHDTSILNSKWPYYWLYFSNWCFTLFVITFVVDTFLVMKRYLLENVQFKNIVQLELWYNHFYYSACH